MQFGRHKRTEADLRSVKAFILKGSARQSSQRECSLVHKQIRNGDADGGFCEDSDPGPTMPGVKVQGLVVPFLVPPLADDTALTFHG